MCWSSSREERETVELPSSTDKLYLGRESIGYRRIYVIGTICCSKLLSSAEQSCITVQITETASDSSVTYLACPMMALSSLGL